LQRSLNAKVDLRIRTLSGEHTDEQIAKLETEINDLLDKFNEANTQIRDTSPGYGAMTEPPSLFISDIQRRLLDSDTILLEYSLGDRASYLWAVTPGSIEGFQLPSRRTIEELSRRAYDLITSQQPLPDETGEQHQRRAAGLDAEYWRLARQLSRNLLAPAASQISNKRLLIVAEGALQYIPFSSLPAPDGAGDSHIPRAKKTPQVRPLIVEHEIVILPSISTLEALRRELAERQSGNNTIAIFADPVFTRDDPRVKSQDTRDQPRSVSTELLAGIGRAFGDVGNKGQVLRIPRLESTQIESNAIVEAAADGASTIVSRDFDATLARLAGSDTALCRIVHLATHGILNNEHPELSGVILSMIDQQGRVCDGFLALNAVYNLRLKADLVVLSACNTGLGKDIRGEGLVGLTRGFMYAGARRVVATSWQVNDIATSRLMSLFYKGMFKSGLQPTAALRAAQIEMWKTDRWKSPFFWAAFHIQGEWTPDAWRW
jgi:CHAT domain-containing protein